MIVEMSISEITEALGREALRKMRANGNFEASIKRIYWGDGGKPEDAILVDPRDLRVVMELKQ